MAAPRKRTLTRKPKDGAQTPPPEPRKPFAALDPLLRRRMRQEVRGICQSLGTPTVLITHDPDDVLEFGGTVALYENGTVREVCEFADGPAGGLAARDMLLASHFGVYAEDRPPLAATTDPRPCDLK